MISLSEKAKLVRKWCMISTTQAGSGHPTSCMSAADIMTVLFDKYLTYDVKNPNNLANDRLIFSKGHAAPLLYTLYALSGAYPIEELKTLRKFSSRLEGHPTPHYPYAEAATGSLGQGLSVGAGLAIGIKGEKALTDKPKVYVLLGDGELAEGQIWEAANFAGHYQLNNLIAIADINRLGQSQETMFGHNLEQYKRRFEAFGWETIIIDGHNIDEIDKAFQKARDISDKPVAIIAKTFKGRGISFLENKEGWHGKPLAKEDLDKALRELGDVKDEVVFNLRIPQQTHHTQEASHLPDSPITYQQSDQVATRDIYGKELAELGKHDDLIMALDGEVKNSTFSIDFMKAFPDRFIECFIAEQNMVSVAVGLSRLGRIPFVSSFAAFLERAADQIRMARLSNANIKFVGSHCGVSIGEDGTSQMGLEDVSMFGAVPDSVIFHPADAVSTTRIIPLMAKHRGISYLRTLRPKTNMLYDESEIFTIGGSKILKSSTQDLLTIVAMGITVHEALKAYNELKQQNILVRVIDAYCVKPIDKETLRKSAQETKKNILITVEDHYDHGGLGDSVLAAVAMDNVRVAKMAVTAISHSGTKDELLDAAYISAKHIVEKVKSLTE